MPPATSLALLAAAAIALPPPAAPTAAELTADLDALVAAYPDALKGHDAHSLLWRNGPAMPIGDQAPKITADRILAQPTIRALQSWRYPLAEGATSAAGDPGRVRPAALFDRLYGDCGKGEVEPQLVRVPWIDGHSVHVTRAHGVAAALGKVARELAALGPSARPYLWPISGTYNCRKVAGSDGVSMHGYGAAIDLASRYGSYWRWSAAPAPERTIPPEIVRIFERHGFIWGGKWAHYDSFHFEYRPEIIARAR